MQNRVLEKFKKGEKSLGTFTHLMSAPAIEVLARTPLDYVLIDMEHSPICAESAAALVSTASGVGLGSLVRIDSISRSPVLKMLDAGAGGLVVPQVETTEQVRQLISWAKFAPLGGRGYCPTRDGGWGYSGDYAGGMDGYMKSANTNTLLIPQCETVGCLENIEEIVAMEGVDGIFVGPFDLSISMGIPGQFDNPLHIAAVERVRRACADAGKLCIMFTGAAVKAAGYFAQGFDSVTLGLDINALAEAYSAMAEIALK